MLCPNCGAIAADNASFCTECGASLTAASSAQAEPEDDVVLPDAADDAANAVDAADDAAAAVADDAAAAAATAATAAATAAADPFAVYAPQQPAQPASPYDPLASAQTQAFPQQPAQPAYPTDQLGFQPETYMGQPAQPTSPYASVQPTSGVAIAALVVGIIALVSLIAGPFAIPIALVALILGIIGAVTTGKNGKRGRGMAIAGIVMGVLSLVLSVVLTVALGLVVYNAVQEDPDALEGLQQIIDLAESGEDLDLNVDDDGNLTLNGRSFDDWDLDDLEDLDDSGTAVTPIPASSFDVECTDGRGNITIYAISELAGSDLMGLLADLTYEDFEDMWISDDLAYFAAYRGADVDEMDADDLANLPAGGGSSPTTYYLSVPGYTTARDALAGMAPMVVQDSADLDDGLVAVVYGPSMHRFFVMANEDDYDGNWNFYIFNNEAVEAGVLDELVGEQVGSTIEDAWSSFTGSTFQG